MGVNATGTLRGVAGRAPKTRESRRRRRRGVGLGRGCAPSQKIYEFSAQNGVVWCILGVLFLRFMCPMDCIDCMINFIEVPVCAKRTIQTGKSMSPQTSYIFTVSKLTKILGDRQHRSGQILGSRRLQPMRRWRLWVYHAASDVTFTSLRARAFQLAIRIYSIRFVMRIYSNRFVL